MEIVTGRLSIDMVYDALKDLIHVLLMNDINTVLVTFGSGCNRQDLGINQDILVPSRLLLDFVDKQEDDCVFCLGINELFIKSDDGRISILLCEMSDVHCYTEDSYLLNEISLRWSARWYESYAIDREKGVYRRLRESMWKSMTTDASNNPTTTLDTH